MALNRVLGLFVCGAVLGSLLLASGCGDSGPGSASGGGTFEGNWVMAASETGNRAIANSTRAHAAVLEGVFRLQTEVIRPGAGGNDQRMGFHFPAAERLELERPTVEVDFDDIVSFDSRAEVDRLLLHQVHQLGATDAGLLVRRHDLSTAFVDRVVEVTFEVAGRKAREVLDLGG